MIPHNRPWIDDYDHDAVRDVMRSGWIAQGVEVEKLEDWFVKHWGKGSGGAVAVCNGTAALWLALKVLLEEGTHIQIPTYACSAILHAALMAKCIPSLRDVDRATYSLQTPSLDPRHAILIDTFGGRAAMWYRSGRHIRDATHAWLPPEPNDDAAICSFGPTKPITGGGGGIVWFRDQSSANKARAMRDWDGREWDFAPSFNIQMNDLTATLINSQIRRLDQIKQLRRAIAEEYASAIPISYPVVQDDAMRYRYVVEVPNAEEFVLYMKKHGVQCIYPVAAFELLHQYMNLNPNDFPVAEMIARKAVSIPFYPSLHEAEIAVVCAALKAYRP